MSSDDLAANKIYPLAANQPTQQAFQVEVWPPQIIDGQAVRVYQDIPLDEARQQLIAQIHAKRNALEAQFQWIDENGDTWLQSTDSQSQLKLQSCIQTNFNDYWFFENGNRVMNATQLQDLLNAGMQHVTLLFQKQKAKLDEVNALASVDECRAFDVNAGW